MENCRTTHLLQLRTHLFCDLTDYVESQEHKMLCTLCQVSSNPWSKQCPPKKAPVSISAIRKWGLLWVDLCSTQGVPAAHLSYLSFQSAVGLIRTGCSLQLSRAAQQSHLGLALASRDVTGMAAGPPGSEPLPCHTAVTLLLPSGCADRTGLWEITECRDAKMLLEGLPSAIHSLLLQETFSCRGIAADHLDTDKCQKRSAKSFLYKCSISLPMLLRYAAIQTSASFHLQASVIPKMVVPSSSAVQFQHSFILVLVPVVLWNRDCFAFYERGIYL